MSRWVRPASLSSDVRRPNVFCFPFAGGGASYYRGWTSFGSRVAICPVQLPGREERFKERALDRMPDVVAAAAEQLAPLLQHPYAFFGHSMGALICYELVHALRVRGAPMPMHLFVSASPAPQLASEVPSMHDVPEDRFFEELGRYGGLPAEVLQHRELLALVTPLLRADLAVTGTYHYGGHPPLGIPITAFGGQSDLAAQPPLVEAWRARTAGAFACELFPGGHFYLKDHSRAVVSRMDAALS